MFLYCSHMPTLYTDPNKSVSGFKLPTKLNWFDFTCPVKSINGSKSGPTMIASFLESIKFRNATALKMPDSIIDSLITNAHNKDIEFESILDEFSSSDAGYVTLENYLNAVKDANIIPGNIVYSTDENTIKRFIHKYKCAIIETYLANSFLSENASGVFNITTAGTGEIKVKDYTKVFIAFGYDETGLIVFNSLGKSWGSLGFARIKWDVLRNGKVQTTDGEKNLFIKAAAFKNCFN